MIKSFVCSISEIVRCANFFQSADKLQNRSLFYMKSTEDRLNKKISADITPTDNLIVQSVARLDGSALGMALGTLFGAGIFFATNFLILKQDTLISSSFSLLNQYFWGYSVTFAGSLVGLVYGFVSGFIMGWLIAYIRNFVIKVYLYMAKYKERMISVNNFIDYP